MPGGDHCDLSWTRNAIVISCCLISFLSPEFSKRVPRGGEGDPLAPGNVSTWENLTCCVSFLVSVGDQTSFISTFFFLLGKCSHVYRIKRLDETCINQKIIFVNMLSVR